MAPEVLEKEKSSGAGGRTEAEPALVEEAPAKLAVTTMVQVPHSERGQNRGPQHIEWSLYSVKKCLIDAIWSLKVSY